MSTKSARRSTCIMISTINFPHQPSTAGSAGASPSYLTWVSKESHSTRNFKLDEAWNSPNNIALLTHMPKEFATEDLNGPDRQKTRILAVIGPRCAFNEDGTSISKITDGSTNTVCY